MVPEKKNNGKGFEIGAKVAGTGGIIKAWWDNQKKLSLRQVKKRIDALIKLMQNNMVDKYFKRSYENIAPIIAENLITRLDDEYLMKWRKIREIFKQQWGSPAWAG